MIARDALRATRSYVLVMDTQSATPTIPAPADGAVETFDTIVIGGGQAGLSLGYYLKKNGGSAEGAMTPSV